MASKLGIEKRQSGERSGLFVKHELDLSTKDFQTTIVGPSMLGLKSCAVQIRCEGCTGTSGNASLTQSNEQNIATHLAIATSNIALGVNTNAAQFNVALGGEYVGVDLTAATLGSVGKIIITFVAKHG